MLWNNFSQHGVSPCGKRIERSKAEDILFSSKQRFLFRCQALLLATSFHRQSLNSRFWSILKWKDNDWRSRMVCKSNLFCCVFSWQQAQCHQCHSQAPALGWEPLPRAGASHVHGGWTIPSPCGGMCYHNHSSRQQQTLSEPFALCKRGTEIRVFLIVPPLIAKLSWPPAWWELTSHQKIACSVLHFMSLKGYVIYSL